MHIKKIFVLLFLTISLSVFLTEIYNVVDYLDQESQWLSAAIFNTIFAIAILIVRAQKPDIFSKNEALNLKFAVLPSLFILLFSICGALITSQLTQNEILRQDVKVYQIAWVFWVPIVEEITFRMGISTLFQRVYPGVWASYFSIILFSILHSNPTLENFIYLNIGLPLGPLLLGLCCEYLYQKTSKIWPSILFHATCNSTIVIFSLLDARWLQWLNIFYL